MDSESIRYKLHGLTCARKVWKGNCRCVHGLYARLNRHLISLGQHPVTLPHNLAIVGNAKDLESNRLEGQLAKTKLINVDISIDVLALHRVALSITHIVDGEVGVAGAVPVHALEVEHLSIGLGLVDDETLVGALVLSRGFGTGQDAVVAMEGVAVHLEGEVAALGQLAAHALEALLGCEGRLLVLGGVRRVRADGAVARDAQRCTRVLALTVHERVGDVWKSRDGVIGVGEVEGLGQVGHVGPAPGRDFWSHDIDTLGGQPLLDEGDLRGVVGVLGVDMAATGPWGDDVEGNAEARSDVGVARVAVRILDPLGGSTGLAVEGNDVIACEGVLVHVYA